MLTAPIKTDSSVASLIPFGENDRGTSFRERNLIPEFDALPEVSGETTAYVSEDRDRLQMELS